MDKGGVRGKWLWLRGVEWVPMAGVVRAECCVGGMVVEMAIVNGWIGLIWGELF